MKKENTDININSNRNLKETILDKPTIVLVNIYISCIILNKNKGERNVFWVKKHKNDKRLYN